MAKTTFTDFNAALNWAKQNAADHIWPFQRWRIVPQGRAYAVGIYNVNTGKLEGFANA